MVIRVDKKFVFYVMCIILVITFGYTSHVIKERDNYQELYKYEEKCFENHINSEKLNNWTVIDKKIITKSITVNDTYIVYKKLYAVKVGNETDIWAKDVGEKEYYNLEVGDTVLWSINECNCSIDTFDDYMYF